MDDSSTATPTAGPPGTNHKREQGEGKSLSVSEGRRSLSPRWCPDRDAEECFRVGCGTRFSFFGERRHHCRLCGGIFCDSCSSSRLRLPDLGYDSPVRVCARCRADHNAGLVGAASASEADAAGGRAGLGLGAQRTEGAFGQANGRVLSSGDSTGGGGGGSGGVGGGASGGARRDGGRGRAGPSPAHIGAKRRLDLNLVLESTQNGAALDSPASKASSTEMPAPILALGRMHSSPPRYSQAPAWQPVPSSGARCSDCR